MTELYIKMILSLSLVLTIIMAAYFIVKKRMNFNYKLHFFEIIDYKSFGPKMGIMAVKFADKILLLGFTPSGISLIDKLDAEPVLNENKDKEELFAKIKRLKESLYEPY